MRIGELAKASGFSIDALRWYDRIGLLRPDRRNPINRFREYSSDALYKLTLIQLAKVAGLALPQIRKILRAASRGDACDQVIPMLGDRIFEIDSAIRALRKLRSRLAHALRTGSAQRSSAGFRCPILSKLGTKRHATPGDALARDLREFRM